MRRHGQEVLIAGLVDNLRTLEGGFELRIPYLGNPSPFLGKTPHSLVLD
jgi:hypothetical protein